MSGIGLVCRWPMSEPRRLPLRTEDGAGFGEVVHVVVDGDRGTIQLFAVVLDYPLDGSGIRQAQVRQLASFVSDIAPKRDLVIVCGDFNAGPDSDEIRMLTGRSASASPGLVFYDSWEIAGDGSPRLHLVQPQFPGRDRPLPRPALRLHPLGLAAAPSCRTPDPLLAARRPSARRGPDLRPHHYGLVAELRY